MGSPFFRQPVSSVGSSSSVLSACVREEKSNGNFNQMNIHSLWFGCLKVQFYFYLLFSTEDSCNLGDIRYYCSDQFDRHDSINNNGKDRVFATASRSASYLSIIVKITNKERRPAIVCCRPRTGWKVVKRLSPRYPTGKVAVRLIYSYIKVSLFWPSLKVLQYISYGAFFGHLAES